VHWNILVTSPQGELRAPAQSKCDAGFMNGSDVRPSIYRVVAALKAGQKKELLSPFSYFFTPHRTSSKSCTRAFCIWLIRRHLPIGRTARALTTSGRRNLMSAATSDFTTELMGLLYLQTVYTNKAAADLLPLRQLVIRCEVLFAF
jgi:hypothetical protein